MPSPLRSKGKPPHRTLPPPQVNRCSSHVLSNLCAMPNNHLPDKVNLQRNGQEIVCPSGASQPGTELAVRTCSSRQLLCFFSPLPSFRKSQFRSAALPHSLASSL